jgi:DNA recombination protein RmuC
MTGLTVFIAVSLAANVALLVALIARPRASGAEAISERLAGYEKRLDRQDAALREEFSRNRMELTATFTRFSGLLEQKLAAVQESVHASGKAGREELTLALKSFEGRVESMREAVERRLTDIQQDNAAKLERMRETSTRSSTRRSKRGSASPLSCERAVELVQKALRDANPGKRRWVT